MTEWDRRSSARFTTALVAGLLAISSGCGAIPSEGSPSPTTEPDYTQGEPFTLSPRTWSIGPTGAFGNIWYDENLTEGARMIQVTEVTEGSPADGVLRQGDVILGIAGGRFTVDPRKRIAHAITQAEKTANGDELVLTIWRPANEGLGDLSTVTIVLATLGSYSTTSPWHCEKTNAIIDGACRAIVKRGLFNKDGRGQVIRNANVNRSIDALGLLATGDPKYLPLVKDYVDVVCATNLDAQQLVELKSWNLAYMNILMCEYHLLTGDRAVLPAIEACASRIVDGRSGVGTWGHSMRMPHQRYAAGYGSMNQIGLTLTISLLLTQRCGVDVPDLDKAVEQSLDFFRYFIAKGSIPYGDHGQSGGGFAGNGKSAQAAVMFDLAGDRAGTAYFTRQTLASYNELEGGHTGHFFNGLWGPMGAARGGDEAAQSYSNAIRWFTETERRYDGDFVFQPGQTRTKQHKYRNWSTAGARLLHYCLPRKALYITGKGQRTIAPLVGNELKQAAEAGRIVKAIEGAPASFSTEKLLGLLSSWSPAVRRAAAIEIGQRDRDLVDRLIDMLDSNDPNARYGACEALHFAGRQSEAAADALAEKALTASDPLLRHFAIKALRIPRPKEGREHEYKHALGETSRRAGPVLLKLSANPVPGDPMNRLHFLLAETLFYGGTAQGYVGHYPRGEGLENVDRKLLVRVVRSLLTNTNGRARSMVAEIYPALTQTELDQLWRDIYLATKYQAPSGVMFAFEVRARGLELMADRGYVEGIDLAMEAFRQEGWGHHKRNPAAITALAQYGENIKPHMQELETYFDANIATEKKKLAANPESKFVSRIRRKIGAWQEQWHQLQDAVNTPRQLRSLAEYLGDLEGDVR